MKMERVTLCRLDKGLFSTDHVANCVWACGLSRRTVEVTWDGQTKQLVFSVVRPMTKRVAKVVANIERSA